MPITLVPPRPGRSQFYRIRGTYLGRHVDRTTETTDRTKARRFLKAVIDQIERGQLAGPDELTLAEAALSYIKAGGERRFLAPITEYFVRTHGANLPARDVTQAMLDEAAVALYPRGTAGTRNRQFYTPVSAILRHAGIERMMRRPKGAQGTPRTRFLNQDEARRLLLAARAVDDEFGIFVAFLLYTGLRLSEGLRVQCRSIDLSGAYAYVEITKSGQPRPLHLPPPLIAVLANHPRGIAREGRAFRFSKSGHLYTLLREARLAAGLDREVTFHTLRHTWAAWMRRHAGLDTTGLVATGAWASRAAAARYEHANVSDEARRADLLPNVTGRNAR